LVTTWSSHTHTIQGRVEDRNIDHRACWSENRRSINTGFNTG